VKKKRREILPPVTLGLHSSGGAWVKSLSGGQPYNQVANCGRYGICPVFGKGEILHYQWQQLELIISRFELRQDIVLRHTHEDDCLQLSFLLEGQKIIKAEGQTELIQEKGNAYLASLSGFRGTVRLGCEMPFTEIKIRVGPAVVEGKWFLDFKFSRQLSEQQQIRPIPQHLFAILLDLERHDLSEPVQWIYLRAKALELLALQMERYRHSATESPDGHGNLNLRKLFRVRNKIADNLHENYSLAELSSEAGISTTQLNEEFCKTFGLSISEFSIQSKMELARQLLTRTDQLIYEVSEAVGYKNATHFSAAFKRHSGKTPKQFRNSQ
jgi:AraC-like DNA-binding protein